MSFPLTTEYEFTHLVMWLLGEGVTVSNNVAEVVGIVAEHVVDLTCSIGLVLRAFDSRIGRLDVEGYKKQHRYIYGAPVKGLHPPRDK